ncbi:hypothetical protein HDU76_009488 [Blyttiomyces sp. JEL0837]|nr:hypothetical protein HDU76_009488 [Blyttiomyces sp. JEL0837]
MLWLHLGANHWSVDDVSATQDELLEVCNLINNIDVQAEIGCAVIVKHLKLVANGFRPQQAATVCASTAGVSTAAIIEKFDALVEKGVSEQQAATVCASTPGVSTAAIIEKFDALVEKGVSEEQAATVCASTAGVSTAAIIEKFDALVEKRVSKEQAATVCAQTAGVSTAAITEKFNALVGKGFLPQQAASACYIATEISTEELMNKYDGFINHYHPPKLYAINFFATHCKLSLDELIDLERRFPVQATFNVELTPRGVTSLNCPVPGCKRVGYPSAIAEHIICHCEEMWEFDCSKCGKTFSNKGNRDKHVDEVCGKVKTPRSRKPLIQIDFDDFKLYESAIKQMPNQKGLVCPVPGCESSFTFHWKMLDHLVWHCQDARDECLICHKKQHPGYLKRHQRTCKGGKISSEALASKRKLGDESDENNTDFTEVFGSTENAKWHRTESAPDVADVAETLLNSPTTLPTPILSPFAESEVKVDSSDDMQITSTGNGSIVNRSARTLQSRMNLPRVSTLIRVSTGARRIGNFANANCLAGTL